jgi:hypothetical protein
MKVKKKLKVTKALIAACFFICIIAIVTPVLAAGSNHAFFMGIGDDLDLNATNLILGKIEFDEYGEPSSVKAVFHQRIYDESGEKVYTMKGMLKDGDLVMTNHYFLCPVFGVWFINVWWFLGMGVYKTSDTNLDIIYRNWFQITLPNTEGKYVSAPILMFLSLTGEYCLQDPGLYTPGTPDNPVYVMEQGGWVLTGVLCGIIVQTPFGPTELPIGPASFLTKYLEN